ATINILDTPGHADFGGEVERIMKMVDRVILVVDAYEGTMPQTRFVLKKALEQGLKPLVVLNKIDRPSARPEEVVDEVLDLFIDLGADDEQLEFPVLYASAINGMSGYEPNELTESFDPVFDTILERIPAPVDNSEEPLQFQVIIINTYGTQKKFRFYKLFGFISLERTEIKKAQAGVIVAVSGMEDINIGETICPQDHPEALPILRIDEPTLQMTFLVNNSP